ncbi:MAG: neutral/alkaline non-lysosomal ceramidase N-terminal domain-containing protein [Deferrisomatales bacterium]|nr:neutral/alkaline non-lysosomal ceramidase N-terminal domain-containing protein [Deferrisomatales bacterium]
MPPGRLRPGTAAALLSLFLAGCLPVDHTPLDEQPFYRTARRALGETAAPEAVVGPLWAGAARVEVAPPAGGPLGGHGGRRAAGVHDPVFARALVLANGHTTVALVSVDLLLVTGHLTGAVGRAVEGMVPVAADAVMIAATHTHSGPGGLGRRVWERVAAGRFDREFFDSTVERMAQAVAEAHRRLEPVRLSRRRFDAPDLIANRMVRGGVVDSEVAVLVLEAREAARKIYVVNFAAHPTVLGKDNRLVSGDFPGFLCRALEEGEDAVALYLAGAVADQRPTPPGDPDPFRRAERMGKLLAERVRAAPPLAPPRDRAALWSRRVALPLPPPQVKVTATRRLPSWIGALFLDPATNLHVLSVDSILLAGVPAEVGVEVGLEWKSAARAAGRELLVVGFANDYIGYVMPAHRYAAPAYEARMAFHGPHVAEYLGRFLAPLTGSGAAP